MTRVAVTGATGFVGGRLVRRLVGRGDFVLALVRTSSPELDDLGVRQVLGDVVEIGPSVLDGFDAVVHAAVTGSQELSAARRVNRDGTDAVSRAALAAGVRRLVHLSTGVVYDFPLLGDVEVHEDAALVRHGDDFVPEGEHPTVYAVSKVEGENRVRAAARGGLSATILRPTGVLGPGPTSDWGTGIPRMLLAGHRFPRHPETTFGYVGVADLVEAIVAAIDHRDSTTANVVGGHVPFGALLDVLEAGVAAPGTIQRADDVPPWRGRFATDRMHDVLGVVPSGNFEELMEEIVSDLR